MGIFKINSKSPIVPEFFSQHAISKETSEFNHTVRQQSEHSSYLDLSVQEVRSSEEKWATAQSEIAQDHYILGRTGNNIKLRIFTPDQVEGVYLFIHGGGWISGAAGWQDKRLETLAKETKLVVVSVEYRLAPEHKYPCAIDDCEDAALWLVNSAFAEFRTERLLIGGGSAGAHLCALTLLRMRDNHAYTGFVAANLVFGVYDLGMTPSMRNWGKKELILSTPIVERLIEHFLPTETNRQDAAVSPLYADLRQLPPAIFTIGTADPLLDDTLFMYMKWISSGNEAELVICPGGAHGFITTEMEIAIEARKQISEFLVRKLGSTAIRSGS